jgi:hypothetical protein
MNALNGKRMAAPKKQLKKTGFKIALFIDCIAAINSLSGNLARPGVTEKDHEKNNPAMRPVVIAVRESSIFFRFI